MRVNLDFLCLLVLIFYIFIINFFFNYLFSHLTHLYEQLLPSEILL